MTATAQLAGVHFYFPLGCLVRSAFRKSKNKEGCLDWYNGWISSWRSDGTYDIIFDDDDSIVGVPENEIELEPEPEEKGKQILLLQPTLVNYNLVKLDYL